MRYQNNQLWSECQLVSIWNACRYWGMDNYLIMGTKRYKLACRDAKAIGGSVIGLSSQLRKYNIVRVFGSLNFMWARNHLPIELGVHCHRGYHSVLVVDTCGHEALLANYARDRTYWLGWPK